MKKLLLYIVVAIVVISCGMTIYFVVRNDENIYSTVDENIYLNIGETMSIPVNHDKPNSKTKLSIEVSSENLEVNEENWTVKAVKEGIIKLKIVSSNTNFGPFEFIVNVGNGSEDYPYFIRDAEDFKLISTKYGVNNCFILTSDIDLDGVNFEPIGTRNTPFVGSFQGNGFSINNLIIDQTNNNTSPVGLFSAVGVNGLIENLILNNISVTSASQYTGIVAGINYGTIGKIRISNSNLMVSNNGSNYSGLICGLNETKSSYARVSLCTVSGNIYSTFVSGGLVGYNKGGVVDNNKVTINNVTINPLKRVKELEYSYFGGIAGYTCEGDSEVNESIFVNNLVIINNIDNKGAKVGGLFGETFASSQKDRGYYSMLLYNTPLLLNAVGINVNDNELESTSKNALNFVSNITVLEKTQKNTYVNPQGSIWNFDSIWKISEGSDINLDYNNDNFNYQEIPCLGSVIEIEDSKSLKKAIEYMRTYPSAPITYKIMGESTIESTIDENGEQVETIKEKTYTYTVDGAWEPIGNKDNPFMGKIIAEKDAIMVIKNLNIIDGDYTGFFGYIGNSAEINNIRISSASISGKVSGGITGFNAHGKIYNCEVVKTEIYSEKYAGGIAGYNSGVIDSCLVTNLNIDLEKDLDENIYVAGITGKTIGTILNSVVEGFDFETTIESKDNTICIGGIAGCGNNTKIQNNVVSGVNVDTLSYSGRSYFGGVVGHNTNTEIKDCYVYDSRTVNLNCSNEKSVAGGLVGYALSSNNDTTLIKNSSVCGIIINAYYSAGLVSFCLCNVDACCVGTTACLEGKYVGGLTCNLYGNLTNIYSLAELKGSEAEAGLTDFLWQGSSISYCYSYCSYIGDGKAYVETISNYKAKKNIFGTISNSIIIGYNNQELAKGNIQDFLNTKIISRDGQKKVFVQVEYYFIKGKYIFIDENKLIGVEDNYEAFIKNEFDKNIWQYDEGTNISPILVNAKYYSKDDFVIGEILADAE